MKPARIACFEIVHFSFRAGVPPAAQLAHLETLGTWASTQPGFLQRRCYRDDERNCWTDVVSWASVAAARTAAEKALVEPSLEGAMAAIDQAGMSFGHYTEALATDAPHGRD